MVKRITKIEAKEAKATISRKNSDGTEQNSHQTVGKPGAFDVPPCNVGVTLGGTFPDKVGYGNTKISVSLHIPCLISEIGKTYEFAKEWVDDKLSELIDESGAGK